MSGTLTYSTASRHPAKRDSRRNFLWQLSALCVGALIPWKTASAIETDPATRIATQWKRIKGGLPAPTLATCERVAAKLAPQAAVLLNDSKWEGRTYKAIVDELRAAGIYPENKAKDRGKDAESLRGEAQNTGSSSGAVSASITTAQATVAVIPVVGPVIAAVLLLIAAIIMLIAQLQAKTLEDQAAAKEKQANKGHLEKVRAMELRLVKVMESLDDCVLFGKRDNCKPA